MPRTAEHLTALKELSAAIEAVMRHNGVADDSIMGDWIVVAAEVRFDSDGDPAAAYHTMHPNGASLDHTALGLLELAREFVLHPEIAEPGGAEAADDDVDED